MESLTQKKHVMTAMKSTMTDALLTVRLKITVKSFARMLVLVQMESIGVMTVFAMMGVLVQNLPNALTAQIVATVVLEPRPRVAMVA